MSYRSGARASSSSTVRIPAMPLPMTTRRSPLRLSDDVLPVIGSDPRRGKARRALRQKALAHVVPPGQREAADIECQEHDQRQMRAAGTCDRGTEAARDQIAAARADRPDKAERGGAFERRRLDRRETTRFAFALRGG